MTNVLWTQIEAKIIVTAMGYVKASQAKSEVSAS